MNIIQTCPYGHTCERATDKGIERCVKYIEVATRDEKGDNHQEFKCADVWAVDIAIMNNRVSGHIVHAVDEVRVQATKRQDVALQIAAGNFMQNDVMKTLGVVNAEEDSKDN